MNGRKVRGSRVLRWWGALTLTVLTAATSACDNKAMGITRSPEPRADTVEDLRLVPVKAVEFRPRWEVRGVLAPQRTVSAAFLLGGRLREVAVQRGQQVEEGDVLARLDVAEVGAGMAQAAAAVRAAEAQVKLAADALRRLETLERERAIAEAEVVKVRLQHEAATALRAQAKAALRMTWVKTDQHLLRAPMAGTVLEVPERVGEIIGPGIPQFEIASLDRLRFQGTLPGEAAGQIVLGQEVEIRPRNGPPLTGRLTYVAAALTSDSHRLPFEAELEPPPNTPGLVNSYVQVSLAATAARPVAGVPPTSVVRGETTWVFVADRNGTVRRLSVEVLQTDSDQTLVVGVEPGQSVVDLPPADLADGTRIRRQG